VFFLQMEFEEVVEEYVPEREPLKVVSTGTPRQNPTPETIVEEGGRGDRPLRRELAWEDLVPQDCFLELFYLLL
jgi:hypothetical protein